MNKISILIVNWQTTNLLDRCLNSILNLPQGIDSLEVLVIDNASDDAPSLYKLISKYKNVKFIINHKNLGYAKAINQGLKLSQAEYVFLLNPDAQLLPYTLYKLFKFMEETPSAAAVAPKLLNPDGSLQYSCRNFPTPICILSEFFGLSRIFPKSKLFGKYRMTYWNHQTTKIVQQPMSSALLIRRQALIEINNSLDERFPIFFNDVDLCLRLYDKNWKIYYLPEAEVKHRLGASTSQLSPYAKIWESHSSLIKLYNKHYKSRLNPVFFYLIVFLVFISCLFRIAFLLIRQVKYIYK